MLLAWKAWLKQGAATPCSPTIPAEGAEAPNLSDVVYHLYNSTGCIYCNTGTYKVVSTKAAGGSLDLA